jgi:hypothetical protein
VIEICVEPSIKSGTLSVSSESEIVGNGSSADSSTGVSTSSAITGFSAGSSVGCLLKRSRLKAFFLHRLFLFL